MMGKKSYLLFLLCAIMVMMVGCSKGKFASDGEPRKQAINSSNIVKTKDEIVFTANIDVPTVTVYDAKANKVVKEIKVGRDPVQATLSPDEQWLYVSCLHSNKVYVISTESYEVEGRIATGIEPYGLVTNREGDQLYVATYRSGTIEQYDLTTGRQMKAVKVGDRLRTLAMSADGKKLYATRYLTAKVDIIDPQTLKVTKEITLAESPNKSDRKKSQGIPNTLEQFVITPDGKKAYIPHLLTNVDTPIHFEETIFPAISVIDLQREEELLDERKELFAAMNVKDNQNATMIVSNPYDIVFNQKGTKAYAAMSGSEDIVVFDLARGGNATEILRRVNGHNPRGLLLVNNDRTLLVHNAMSHTLSQVKTGEGKEYATLNLLDKTIALIGKDPLTPLVREGKTIFYSANSTDFATDITGNNWMSCASCHSDGEVNNLTFMTGKGQRNTPSNVLTTKTGLFMWDGTRDEFADYIHTVQGEMGGMMKHDPSKPLPKDVQHMFDAMEAFLDEPTSFPVPQSPYRTKTGQLTASAKDGEKLFNGKANCLSCHSGAYYTDSVDARDAQGKYDLSKAKLHDVGTSNRYDVASKGDARANFTNPRDGKQFDTPTLRGVWATAPYLHDGSARTIEAAITAHKASEIPALTKEELRQVSDFVRSIE